MSRSPRWFAAKKGRRDANHATIRDGLVALTHFVVDTASVGGGVLDLLVWPRVRRGGLGPPVWLEVKTETGELRESQLRFIAQLDRFGIRHEVARTLQQAVEVLQC